MTYNNIPEKYCGICGKDIRFIPRAKYCCKACSAVARKRINALWEKRNREALRIARAERRKKKVLVVAQ